MKQESKTFFPHLDTLRTLAFFMVFINHVAFSIGHKSANVFTELFKYKYLSNGDLGVSFFFVLSGFLITFLLLQEKESSGGIHIRNFYMRRVLRIWPLYFLVILICLLLIPMLQQFIEGPFPMKTGIAKLNPALYLSFLGNVDFFYNGISNSLISILWSVSVEEQFYLAWPLIIAFVPRKYLLPLFITLILASLSYRLFFSGGRGMSLKYHTFSSLSDLCCGALLALLSFNASFRERVGRMPRWGILLAYVAGIILFLKRFDISLLKHHQQIIASFMPLLFALFFAFIIMEQNFAERSLFKAGRLGFISALGRYTYGMYCYHMIVFFFILLGLQLSGMTVVGLNRWWIGLVALGGLLLTIGLSTFSYRYFESFFLKLKVRFDNKH